MQSLKDFMISRVRVRLMELFFSNPKELYYVRQMSRVVKEEINAVRRELDRMLKAGLLKSELRGNRLYYFLNPAYLYYSELMTMVHKSTGLGLSLRKARRKLGTVDYIMFSLGFVQREHYAQDRVDVLVVGEIVLKELEQLMAQGEKDYGREINYAVMETKEFEFRKSRRDPFVMDVLYGARVMVMGNELDFVNRDTA